MGLPWRRSPPLPHHQHFDPSCGTPSGSLKSVEQTQPAAWPRPRTGAPRACQQIQPFVRIY